MKFVQRARDEDIHDCAQQLGFSSSNCDTCGAAGRSEMRVAAASSSGSASTQACPDCGGSGRWWFPDLRAVGSFTAHLTDAELRVLLRSAKGEVLLGKQG